MMRFLKTTAARFCRDESGMAPIEFPILMFAFAILLAGACEMGYLNLRHAMLERGLDTTVREIRLSTGFIPDYGNIRDQICETAAIIPNCKENLRLEMKVVDPRAFSGMPAAADCINAEEVARPLRSFENGEANQLMLLRACLSFKPIFPTTGLGDALAKDSDGYAHITATSSFVQEPR